MKIVSKFHDYYDALRAHDRDPEPLYVRETREHRFGFRATTLEERAIRVACDPLWTNETTPPVPPEPWRRGIVAFCGRIFAFVRNVDTGDVRYTFAHFIDDDADVVDRYRRRQWAHFERTRTRTVDDVAFRFFDAPVLLMDDERVVVNPALKPLSFASQVDPYTAWQDISTFLGNNLVKNVSTPRPVSDELKRDAHGFDRQSFKKAKAPRKKLDRGEW